MQNIQNDGVLPNKSLAMDPDTKLAKRSKEFSASFRLMQLLVVTLAVGIILIGIGALYFVNSAYVSANDRIYVVDKDYTLSGTSVYNDMKSKYFESYNHVKSFAKLLFEFDQNNFPENVEAGLKLIGNDGKIIYNQYRDTDLHNTLIKNNASVYIQVDSILVDVQANPVKAQLYARQTFRTSLGVRENFLWAEMDLLEVSRTKDNIHGLLIEKFKVFNNQVVPRNVN